MSRSQLLRAVREDELQDAVIELAQLLGWRVAHFRPAKTDKGWRTPVAADGKGFPDLVMAHPRGGLIFAELKSERGTMTPEQDAWFDALKFSGATLACWLPHHWTNGAIEDTLRRERDPDLEQAEIIGTLPSGAVLVLRAGDSGKMAAPQIDK